jgi:phosphate transport system permease protein
MPVQPGAGVVGRADEAARMVASRKRWDRFFMIGGAVLSFLCIALLAVLVADLVRDAWPRLEWGFLTRDQSNDAAQAGIKTAILGTALVMIVTAATAIPLGIAAGIYLEEYAKKNWFTTIIEINIANLAGVPSIIWGLMALGLLVYGLKTGQSILTAGLTLGLLVLPIVIVATRESIRAIPQGIREASFACGASRLQTVRYHILPYSMSGVLTGCIIAMSRAIGETAPLVTIGALAYITSVPAVPFSEKAWPLEVVATRAVEVARPEAAIAPSTRDGVMQFRIELPDETPGAAKHAVVKATRDVAIPVGASAAQIVEAIESAPDLTARLDSEGLLRVENEQFGGIVLGKDTSGVAAALAMKQEGGRHGPLDWLSSSFTVLPIQVFDWVSRPQQDFQINAAAAGVVLVMVTLVMNGVAIFLRVRLRKRLQW